MGSSFVDRNLQVSLAICLHLVICMWDPRTKSQYHFAMVR